MLRPWVPLLLVMAFVVANAILLMALSHVLSSFRPNPAKQQPYESGMPVIGDARQRFSVKFYLVAMLFIIFDIETVFLVPWAVAFRMADGTAGTLLLAMLLFVVVLTVGFIYEWKRGALQWD
jgi:NADH-quinone oxidoreductase subunit A